jgi:hypothetical protein
MKKTIKAKIKQLENEAEELIQERDNQERGNELLCAVEILKELIEPRPKNVFLVINPDKFQINGAFSKRKKAEKYANGNLNLIIQKIKVL